MKPSYLSMYFIFFQIIIFSKSEAASCTTSLNWPDGDLPKMPLELPVGLSLSQLDAQCQMMCSTEPSCVASVLLPPGCDKDTREAAVCYLKGALEPQVSTNCTCGALASHSNPATPPQGTQVLQISGDDQFVATFDSRGLLSFSLPNVASASVSLDSFAFTIDGIAFNSSSMANPIYSQPDAQSVVFNYSYGSYTFSVRYDTLLRGGSKHFPFLRKTISVMNLASSSIAIGSVSPFDALAVTLQAAPVGVTYATGDMGTYGAFARLQDGTGLGAAATNPFLYPSIVPAYSANGLLVHVGYHPSFVWNFTTSYDPTVRPFVADSGLIGLYSLSQNAVPPAVEVDSTSSRFRKSIAPISIASLKKEWSVSTTETYSGMRFDHVAFSSTNELPISLHKHKGSMAPSSWLNYAERDFFRDLAEAHFVPAQDGYKTLIVHIPWTENDYQIDISNATQWPEYVRILTQLSRIGVNRILFAGGNSAVSTTANCTDDWGWENVLWLNLGEQLREGYWSPTSSSRIPDSVLQLIDTAGALGVSTIPYIYPILGLGEGTNPNAEWLFPQDDHRNYSTLGNRAYQDYFVDLQVNFSISTNSYGSGFDYTYWIDNSMSDYSQWFGWRRILTNVRNVLGVEGKPQFVVDNRQASHTWSPWMWAAGSYAEPLQSDEQTTSWTAYVQDLHIDRTDGNRQRQMNYDYAQSKLCQPSAMPGFLHHNTDRGDNRRVDLSIRDFDFYGTPYTVLSAVATGGLNMVVCMIPARDEEEYLNFPLSAPDNNTASISFYHQWFDWIKTNEAYLRTTKFLPSPPAPGSIDGTYAVIGTSGFIFLFNPNAEPMTTPDGLLTANADSLDLQCSTGDTIAIGEIFPQTVDTLFSVSCGANFTVAMEGRSALVLTIRRVAAGADSSITSHSTSTAPIFVHHQAVTGMSHNASFTGGVLAGVINVPQAVLDQLSARKALYDVAWTQDDLAISWLAPHRLLLHIDVMRSVPSTGTITATLNGNNIPVYKSWTCRNVRAEMCFQGFFIDLSSDAYILANTDYALSLMLPTGLAAGAFGGVYYENIDTIYS